MRVSGEHIGCTFSKAASGLLLGLKLSPVPHSKRGKSCHACRTAGKKSIKKN
jgi:hypothetical protein